MNYYFVLTTNHAKKNQNAIATLDPQQAVITSEYTRSSRYATTLKWRLETVYMVKCPNMKIAFKVMAELREKMTYCSFRRPTKLQVSDCIRKPLLQIARKYNLPEYTRPIYFQNINEENLEIAMIRTYTNACEISEKRYNKSITLINNLKDFSSIINGDLDLLILSREVANA